MVFERVSPQWSSKWMLEGRMGGSFKQKLVTWSNFLVMFGAGLIFELIFEAIGRPMLL